MASTMGASAPRPATGIRIRRDSYDEATASAWCKQARLSEQDRRDLRSWEFEDWLRSKRRAAKRDLSQGAAVVLKKLIHEMDFKTGFLRVAYAGLAILAQLARSTVQVIIKQLERLGVLERLRTVDLSQEQDGPRWVQGWNAYRLQIPKEFREWLGSRVSGPAGLAPADHLVNARLAREEQARYEGQRRTIEADQVQEMGAVAFMRANPLRPSPPLSRKLSSKALKGPGST